MKKLILTAAIAIMSLTQMFALSTSSIRNHARFISDRMAYELDLTPRQYDDIYEINFDFIYMVNRIMDDVVYGYSDAIEHYYDLLDDRNDDLRYVLTASQYRRFLAASYFYRPIYTTGKTWSFRIYTIYRNHTFFYFDAPVHYKVYAGVHCRHHYGNTSYYSTRYDHFKNDRYNDHFRLKTHSNRNDYQRHDFGGDVRHRNNTEHNKVNNYKNPNSTNRTENKYYRDHSGNTHSPEINHRGATNPGKNSGSTSSNRNSTSTRNGSTSSSSTSSSATRSGSSTSGSGSNNSNSTSSRSSSHR